MIKGLGFWALVILAFLVTGKVELMSRWGFLGGCGIVDCDFQ